MQSAFSWQLSVPSTHSSTSERGSNQKLMLTLLHVFMASYSCRRSHSSHSHPHRCSRSCRWCYHRWHSHHRQKYPRHTHRHLRKQKVQGETEHNIIMMCSSDIVYVAVCTWRFKKGYPPISTSTCTLKTEIEFLPVQLSTPSPEYPGLQVHW